MSTGRCRLAPRRSCRGRRGRGAPRTPAPVRGLRLPDTTPTLISSSLDDLSREVPRQPFSTGFDLGVYVYPGSDDDTAGFGDCVEVHPEPTSPEVTHRARP